jgi:hypothetical protein
MSVVSLFPKATVEQAQLAALYATTPTVLRPALLVGLDLSSVRYVLALAAYISKA